MKARRRRKPIDVVERLDRMIGVDPTLRATIADEMLYAEIAAAAYRARNAARLTQLQLAKRVGTTPSAIARLEDSDYGEESPALLLRIAAALNRRVELRLVSGKRRTRAA